MKIAVLEKVNDPNSYACLSKKETIIGRGLTSDIHLRSESTSRKHAVIRLDKNRFILSDQSSNGTYVTSRALSSDYGRTEKVKVHGLVSGDLITFGDDCEQFLFKEFRTSNDKIAEDDEKMFESETRTHTDSREVLLRARIIGNSPSIVNLHRVADKAMKNDVNVLITGETGTGKGLLARTIHDGSSRRDEPFVDVNCAALSRNLIEDELFGHERGAYTGATDQRLGRFESGNGGTIFLDEIGDMPNECQVKLLHVLEGRGFQRVGGTKTIKTDVRVVAATNCDLLEAIRKNRLREDLYYRLNVIHIHLPPLRKRVEDIPDLVMHFLRTCSRKLDKPTPKISTQAMEYFKTYPYPGNIRELANIIERTIVAADSNEIDVEELSFLNDTHKIDSICDLVPDGSSAFLEEQDKKNIKNALTYCKGIIRHTAARLGMAPNTLYKRLRKYNLDPSQWME